MSITSIDVKEDIGVSIIVPIYNAAAHLVETLHSIADQTYTDFEVLLVDDGSKDVSAQIAKSFCASDSRFHYMFQNNAGAGAARNKGLEFARGKYLAFLDSDDRYATCFLKKMISAIERDCSDICICKARAFDSESNADMGEFAPKNRMPEGAYHTRDLDDKLFQVVTTVPWDKVIKADVVKKNQIRFQQIRYSNDNLFTLMVASYAKKITYTDDILVEYRVCQGSSLRDNMHKNPLCDLLMADALRSNCAILSDGSSVSSQTLDTFCVDVLFKSFLLLACQSEEALKKFLREYQLRFLSKWKKSSTQYPFSSSLKTLFKNWCLNYVSARGYVWACKIVAQKQERFFDRKLLLCVSMRLLIAGLAHI